ncbi:MAG: TPM domain-containing protein [Cryomorphaceae bacterium]
MGRTSRFLAIGLLSFLLATPAFAKDIPPTPKKLVNDYAGVLSKSEVQRLEAKLVSYDNETSTQLSVVTIASLDGDDLFDYSQRLAEAWGIGGGDNDNGVLLLIAIKERGIRIHTGYGTEGAIPDAIAKRIVENEIKPNFRNDDYYGGLNAATDAMIQALAGEYKGEPKAKENAPLRIIPFIIMLVLFIIFARRKKYTGYSHSGRRHYGGPWIGGGFGGGGGGGFGGGGGGFGGFGGGGFGGGGASGSW